MFNRYQERPLISTEDHNLLLGAKPFAPILEPISLADSKAILELVKSENIEYRYINGSCEDRAHYISLLLGKEGILTGKVWNFAPARYSLISTELFHVNDPFGISENTNWGYHVAPYFSSYSESGEIINVVIDQSFSPDSLLDMDQWLEKFNCPRAMHLLTDMDSYLFNSLYGNLRDNVSDYYQPLIYEPCIITGNFWRLNVGDDYVQRGLSINDLALKIHFMKEALPIEEQIFLQKILTNFEWLVNYTFWPKPEELSDQTNDALMLYYNERYTYWSNRLAKLFN